MTEPTREELIELCESAIAPEDSWYDRDSQGAQAQLGEAWALLRAGCEFTLADDPKSTDKTWWISVYSKGFNYFEWGGMDDDDHKLLKDDRFYIPTAASIHQAKGGDWY